MKILSVFNHYLERGGEAIAVEAICASLANCAEVDRCDFWSADWLKPTAPAKVSQALRMFHNPDAASALRAAQTRSRSDVWLVHNVFPVASGAVYSEAQKQGIPVIQYVHNFRPFSVSGYLWANGRPASGGLRKDYSAEILAGAWQNSRAKTAWLAGVLLAGHALGWWRSVSAWIAISDFMRQKFISAGIPENKIFTLRHFWTPRQPPAVSDSGKHYLFLGRLTEAKGIHVLLDAWEKLERVRGTGSPILLIGGDGPLHSAVRARAERMKSVRFEGALSGAAKHEAYAQSKAVIVPSISWEALGLVVYEAYDYVKPVLAARSGGIPELILGGETGLLHEPGNADELANQVLQMEDDSAQRDKMGRAGRAWLEVNARESDWQSNFNEIAEYARR